MVKINLYDFDKTIYDGDSTADFMLYLVNVVRLEKNVPSVKKTCTFTL